MKADLVEHLRCPARDCTAGPLTLSVTQVETLTYQDGPTEEVREGQLTCAACHRVYPITEFVPSFAQLFPSELREEADFWGRWYSFFWDHGYLGLFDLRAPMAPLITEGIEALDPTPWELKEQGGTHVLLADHPLMQAAHRVLDVGCGTGWSSLFLARRGHTVVAFDPSGVNMILAKRYAIQQGIYIEYLAAALGFLAFAPAVFDGLFALHSIHHVPNLRHEMGIMREWVQEGGPLAVDEHVRNHPLWAALQQQMLAWAHAEVYPAHRTLPAEALAGLPQAGHSSLEGAGSDDVIEAFVDCFTLEYFSSRYISLDPFSFLYYLARDQDEEGMKYSANVLSRLNGWMLNAFPDSAEYVTLIGRKQTPHIREAGDLVQQALRLSAGPAGAVAEAGLVGGEPEITRLRERLASIEPHITAKDQFITELERAIAVKNAHIARLEQRIRFQQRTLNTLPIRLIRRLWPRRR